MATSSLSADRLHDLLDRLAYRRIGACRTGCGPTLTSRSGGLVRPGTRQGACRSHRERHRVAAGKLRPRRYGYDRLRRRALRLGPRSDVISFGESAVADAGAGDAGEGGQMLGLAFVAAVESAAAGESGHGPFYGPAVAAQPL